ncbi:MAG: MMPL family transporter [Reichenbachiella sp.]
MTNKLKDLQKGSQKSIVKFAQWVIKFRWPVVIASISLVMILGSGARYVGFNSDYHVFFSDDNPQMLAFDALQNKYTKDDNVFIVIEPRDGKVFTKETLKAVDKLTTDSWQTPYSTRVDAVTNFQHTKALEDDLYVDDLIENPLHYSPDKIEEVKNIAIDEILLRNRLISEDGSLTAVNITVQLPGVNMEEGSEIISHVRGLTEQFETENPELKTYLSGMIMLSGAFQESAFNDMGTLVPLMFLVVILTILLATRTISGTFATLLVIIMSIVSAMGFAGWAGIMLTPPSSAATTIIMTLAVADSIHLLITFIQNMKKGLAKREALVESIRVNFMPVFITSLTTVIGFLSMNFSDSPPFHDLGNITSVGMLAAFTFSIVTLPALMAILPVKIKVKSKAEVEEADGSLLSRLANFVIGNDKKVLWGSVAASVILTLFIAKNEFNEEFIKYFDDRVQFRTDTDYISENLTGIYTLEFSLGSGEEGGINDPAYLKKLEEFENWLEGQPEIVHVNAFSEIARRINKSMHGDSSQYYRIPESREEAAQFLLLYEMSLPFGLDLNNQVNVDKSETRLIATTTNLSSVEFIDMGKKAENWLKENAPETMYSDATSTATMFSHLTKRQVDSMMTGSIAALILISIILMIVLRSFRHGLISLIPNLLPVAVGFGVWGITSGIINVGISIVFGMTLGIIVDDTVHFLSKYLRARRELEKSKEEAVRFAFDTVGKALVVTTIVLIAGFAILAQSSFGMNSGMAQITVIIISFALILDFLLLPALLLNIGSDKKAVISSNNNELTTALAN